MRSYTLQGVRIAEQDGWHEIEDEALAARFAAVRIDPENPDSLLAFDVMEKDAAIAYEAEQKRLAVVKATADDPIKVRRVRPVDDASPAAYATHYGRPPGTSPNRERTHLARPDETEASRNVSAVTGGEVPGAPLSPEEEGGDEYDLAVADLGSQVVKQRGGVRAAEQAPFLDGSQMTARVGDPDKRNPDPRNLGERKRGGFDDTPFVDGSRDAVVPPQDSAHGADTRNPDPRNTGMRAAGAFDDTPFVDGSRDAVIPPVMPPKTLEDEAQMQPVDASSPPRAYALEDEEALNPAAPGAPTNTADPLAQPPGGRTAPPPQRGGRSQPQPQGRTRTRG